MDNLWGPAVIGLSATYPGGENSMQNYRAPSASAYSYVGYLPGSLVPALGLSGTAFYGNDRGRGLENAERPPYMVSVNASVEWSTDWIALLAGVSQPFWTSGRQPWTAGVGLALSPF
jgi:hypothetical protein